MYGIRLLSMVRRLNTTSRDVRIPALSLRIRLHEFRLLHLTVSSHVSMTSFVYTEMSLRSACDRVREIT